MTPLYSNAQKQGLSGTKMSNHPASSSALSGVQRIGFIVIVAGVLVVLPGCGIPQLRCAKPGPALPNYYSWNNGAPLGPPAAAPPSQPTPTPATAATDAGVVQAAAVGETQEADSPAKSKQGFLSRIKLTSLVYPASLLSSDDADRAASQAADADDLPPPASDAAAASKMKAAATEDADRVRRLPAPLELGVTSQQNSACLPLNAFFDDPYLLGLIDQALSGNQELLILNEEIRIANNEVYARSGEYRPFVTYGAGAGLEKSSRFTRDGAVEDQLEAAPGRGFPEPLPDFLVATNVSWELDIWKKLRNAQSAAAMRFLGTREGRNYIVTRMVAEIAENYYELLALDNRLATLEKTIEIQEKSLDISQSKKEAGRGTELAVQRFQAEVRKNQSERLIIRQEIVEVENRLNFLVGRYPQPVERLAVEYVDLELNTLSAGVPSQLLQNRADIRQAEREVAAAGLDVRVARARFYPSFGLRAGVGLQAFNTRYLFSTPESLIYNVAADLVGPLINKRAIKADYCSANSAQLQSIYNYQRTVLQAHIEVVNYMTKAENYRQSIEVKKQQLASLEASVGSATKLFQNARAEYVEVLLAQREMMEAKMMLIETKQQQLGAVVNAYQALGGGGI